MLSIASAQLVFSRFMGVIRSIERNGFTVLSTISLEGASVL